MFLFSCAKLQKRNELTKFFGTFFCIYPNFFHTDGLLSILTLTVIFYDFNIKKFLKPPNKKQKNPLSFQKKYYIKAIIHEALLRLTAVTAKTR
jgi:hypothetical protein